MQIDQVFECEFADCGKRFTTKFSLKRHYYIHSKQKTFSCQYCSKTFALPQYLREHQYTHTNQQPFVCGVDGCTETFRQRGKLSLHRRTHEAFKKKDYRLLNSELVPGLKVDFLGKQSQRIDEEDESTIRSEQENKNDKKCAKTLSQNWSPLKRQKLDHPQGSSMFSQFSNQESTIQTRLNHSGDTKSSIISLQCQTTLEDQLQNQTQIKAQLPGNEGLPLRPGPVLVNADASPKKKSRSFDHTSIKRPSEAPTKLATKPQLDVSPSIMNGSTSVPTASAFADVNPIVAPQPIQRGSNSNPSQVGMKSHLNPMMVSLSSQQALASNLATNAYIQQMMILKNQQQIKQMSQMQQYPQALQMRNQLVQPTFLPGLGYNDIFHQELLAHQINMAQRNLFQTGLPQAPQMVYIKPNQLNQQPPIYNSFPSTQMNGGTAMSPKDISNGNHSKF